MKTIILTILFNLLIISSEEEYFGKYTTINSCRSISFILTDSGVKKLEVDSVLISPKLITYDYLGKFGNSQLFQIHFDDNDSYENLIKLFIVMDGEKFIIASGYYIRFKLDNKNHLQIKYKEAIQLDFKRM